MERQVNARGTREGCSSSGDRGRPQVKRDWKDSGYGEQGLVGRWNWDDY
jgi:hypothetical protein